MTEALFYALGIIACGLLFWFLANKALGQVFTGLGIAAAIYELWHNDAYSRGAALGVTIAFVVFVLAYVTAQATLKRPETEL